MTGWGNSYDHQNVILPSEVDKFPSVHYFEASSYSVVRSERQVTFSTARIKKQTQDQQFPLYIFRLQTRRQTVQNLEQAIIPRM